MPPAFTHSPAVAEDNEGGVWRCTEPKWEARCLVQLLGKNGHTIDKLRELIRVTPKEEAILRAAALHSPVLAEHLERVFRYRAQVAEEFERLIELKGSQEWEKHLRACEKQPSAASRTPIPIATQKGRQVEESQTAAAPRLRKWGKTR